MGKKEQEEIIAENFPILKKNIKLLVQELQPTLKQIN